MPGVAVAGSIVLLHRNGDTAATDFTDNKGQRWRIHLARGDDGYWRVTEIEDIEQLLQKLQHNQPMEHALALRYGSVSPTVRAPAFTLLPATATIGLRAGEPRRLGRVLVFSTK